MVQRQPVAKKKVVSFVVRSRSSFQSRHIPICESKERQRSASAKSSAKGSETYQIERVLAVLVAIASMARTNAELTLARRIATSHELIPVLSAVDVSADGVTNA